jgi:hypothetical protein
MDVLSGPASVIAVVSLAIQLAENAKKLYEFWHSIDEAPQSIREIAAELKLLSNVLSNIAVNDQRYGPNETTTSALESCKFFMPLVDMLGVMWTVIMTNQAQSMSEKWLK